MASLKVRSTAPTGWRVSPLGVPASTIGPALSNTMEKVVVASKAGVPLSVTRTVTG